MLTDYEEKSVISVMERIGAVYERGKWNLDAIPDKIPIETFYHLPAPLREKILNHVLGDRVVAWRLWLQAEQLKIPHYKRSLHDFPHEYKLQYTMGDRSRDLVIAELIGSGEKSTMKRMPTKKKRISATLKRLVWNKAFGEIVGLAPCVCCRLTMVSQLSFHAGHIVSEANGGKTTLDNLVPVCQSCNSSMGTTNMDIFKSRQGFE